MIETFKSVEALTQRWKKGLEEADQLLKGHKMSEQPSCLTCGKPYFKNHPETKGGCQCPPDKRVILKDVH